MASPSGTRFQDRSCSPRSPSSMWRSWRLGALLERRGSSWGPAGALGDPQILRSGGLLDASWSHFEAFLRHEREPSGLSRASLRALLGKLGTTFVFFGAMLEDVDQARGRIQSRSPVRAFKIAAWVVWGACGAILGAFVTVLEPRWALGRASLGRLGAILRVQKFIGCERARMPKQALYF